MKNTITEQEFINTIVDLRPENFTTSGLRTLFNYFEELEQDIGEELNFDPIAICCEFAEYDSFDDLVSDYFGEAGVCPIETDEDVDIGYFEDRTIVIPIEENGAYIIQQF
tara:strand:+ start:1040 stop:1369 length:330 start_codon:yes stop_codon:yes gene_type:complete